MLILICAATEAEIKPSVNFFKTLSLPHTIAFLVTGVGLTATTYNLTKHLTQHKPDVLIQAGIGGTFNEGAPLCQTFVIKSECIGDSGVMENMVFKDLFHLNLVFFNEPPFTNGRLENTHEEWMQKTRLPIAHAVSVNEITTDEERIEHYKKILGAEVESLEGAAFHYVCLMEKVPFLQIRTTSNYIGERNKEKWKLKESILCLNHELQRIILNFEA